MKFNNIKVYNFEGAFKSIRNNQKLNDSFFDIEDDYSEGAFEIAENWIYYDDPDLLFDEDRYQEYGKRLDKYINWLICNGTLVESNHHDYRQVAYLGPKDMNLAQNIIQNELEDKEFLNQIIVSVDITAPLYWWKEFDGSTFEKNKLISTPITLESFEIYGYNEDLYVPAADQTDAPEDWENHWHIGMLWDRLIESLEDLRQAVNAETDSDTREDLLIELIRILPQSWLQTKTIILNYKQLYDIIHQKADSDLDIWSEHFIMFVKCLPYANELIFLKNPSQQ